MINAIYSMFFDGICTPMIGCFDLMRGKIRFSILLVRLNISCNEFGPDVSIKKIESIIFEFELKRGNFEHLRELLIHWKFNEYKLQFIEKFLVFEMFSLFHGTIMKMSCKLFI